MNALCPEHGYMVRRKRNSGIYFKIIGYSDNDEKEEKHEDDDENNDGDEEKHKDDGINNRGDEVIPEDDGIKESDKETLTDGNQDSGGLESTSDDKEMINIA
ncbi:unnamed protein product [Onchocerca flexuosa]|uniref:Uncharacterized protein n=1 Tax=Onchocerca flexuosa TaxID=387005 RepID=A0A183HUN2_9BILA|nr:unnamed protein product [Onchocerca flexuosa]